MPTILDRLTDLLNELGIDSSTVSGIHTEIPSTVNAAGTVLKVDILTARTEDDISQYTFSLRKELNNADN